ncbi:cupin domain-containing protein [Kamptonema cortianum]|nr:cupin domain-containing protein [Oscillatoria laete-virens]MDK3157147.1 cupin domain-containing protein [Kamptonema cortianum]MDL5055030.1 cupin domain-containing protein [Oscillatoria laete-virens NRMC-F 0139]
MMEFSIPVEKQKADAKIEHLLLHIEPGHDFVYHRHDYASDILTVLQGNDLILTVDGRREILQAGDAIITEPPEMHTIFNHGSQPAILLETRVNVVPDDLINCDALRPASEPPTEGKTA